ncbi:hypothetical protein Golob_003860 [Gossypium lobatum]|uniref:Uncharacterized protein n=1 Tax=Gossypium lobatum TaxID=34289 RepID=A0A7J8MZT9_9ROSI|nr:hypothetical protein [Gossypium lobatum]
MDTNFSFTREDMNFGFNPPQHHDQSSQTNIASDQRKETPFFNIGCDGNEFKAHCLKQEKGAANETKSEDDKSTFWTVCPYCYHMYEYEKKYEDCCLVCQTCRKGFHGLAVAAPPEHVLMNGEVREYYWGYGFFPLGYFGDVFLRDKKQVGEGDNGKKPVVVEISDDSDDEKKGMDVKDVGGNVKAENLSNGEGKVVMKRVKSVLKNPKKVMGRGVKVDIGKMKVVEMNDVADIDCGSGGTRLGSDKNGGSDEYDDDELYEIRFYGDDDDEWFDG